MWGLPGKSNIMNKLPAVSVLLSAGILSACSTVSSIPGVSAIVGEDGYLRDRSGEYIEADTIPRTEIPEGLDNYVIDDLYVIPNVGQNDNHFQAPPRPKPMVGRSERQVVIQTIDEESWIIVSLSPGQAWPRVGDYWARNRVPLAMEEPTRGIMETGWFKLEDKPGRQQKFQVLIETGFQDNTAEIRLRQVSVPEGTATGMTNFGQASTDPDVEELFLQDMSTYLADVSDVYQESSVSLLAGNIASRGKATLETQSNGEQYLLLRDDYRRCWAAIGLALDRAGVTINERDQSSGIYEVSFTPEAGDDEPGFFRRLFTFDREPESYEMQIKLESIVDSVNVRVQQMSEEDSPDEDPESSLLQTLRDFIA